MKMRTLHQNLYTTTKLYIKKMEHLKWLIVCRKGTLASLMLVVGTLEGLPALSHVGITCVSVRLSGAVVSQVMATVEGQRAVCFIWASSGMTYIFKP